MCLTPDSDGVGQFGPILLGSDRIVRNSGFGKLTTTQLPRRIDVSWDHIHFVSTAFAIVLAIGACALAARALTSSSVRKINSLALRIASLEETCTALHSVLEGLNQRDKMRKVRAASTSSDGSTDSKSLPDPTTNPAEWKKAMRLRLHSGQLKVHP